MWDYGTQNSTSKTWRDTKPMHSYFSLGNFMRSIKSFSITLGCFPFSNQESFISLLVPAFSFKLGSIWVFRGRSAAVDYLSPPDWQAPWRSKEASTIAGSDDTGMGRFSLTKDINDLFHIFIFIASFCFHKKIISRVLKNFLLAQRPRSERSEFSSPWGPYVDQWLSDGHRSRFEDRKNTESCGVQFMRKYYKHVC